MIELQTFLCWLWPEPLDVELKRIASKRGCTVAELLSMVVQQAIERERQLEHEAQLLKDAY